MGFLLGGGRGRRGLQDGRRARRIPKRADEDLAYGGGGIPPPWRRSFLRYEIHEELSSIQRETFRGRLCAIDGASGNTGDFESMPHRLRLGCIDGVFTFDANDVDRLRIKQDILYFRLETVKAYIRDRGPPTRPSGG